MFNKREKEIFKMYQEGLTFQEIGDKFNFSRSWAQQILLKALQKKISKEFKFRPKNKLEREQLLAAARETMQDMYRSRREAQKEQSRKELERQIEIKMSELPDYKNFATVSSYTRALGVEPYIFQKYFPKIASEIVKKQKTKWSRHYNKCRICSTTSIKHRCLGYCRVCYLKSDLLKEISESSRLRNKEKWRARQREYAKEYSRRPEVVAKRNIQHDLKNYNGNRKKAMRRDKYKCRLCGITKEESQVKYHRDLYVVHIESTNNNNLENLVTLCKKCHGDRAMEMMRRKRKIKKH